MVPRPWLCSVCFLGASALAGPALADDIADATTAFNQGLAHMEAGRYEQGCPAIGESYRLDPRPGTLFTLAECEAKRGRIAAALARYEEYLALFASLPPDKRAIQGDRETISKSQQFKLSREVPKLTLSLPPDAPAGTVVKLDGAVVPERSLGAAVPVDPGAHVVTAETPDGAVTTLRLHVGKSESKHATLKIAAKPGAGPGATPPIGDSPADSGPSAQSGPSGRRVAAYAAGGIGVAGLIVGGITGGLTLGKKSVIEDHCIDSECDAEGIAAADSAKTLGLVSTIGFVLGAAGIGAGAVLLLTEPSAPEDSGEVAGRSAGSPAGAARWVRAGVLTAGHDGAMVGVRGAW